MDENVSWLLINKYFKSDPQILVNHHIKSYNDFFNNKLQQMLNEKNPIVLIKEKSEVTTFDKTRFFDEIRNSSEMKIPVTFEELKNKLSNKPLEYIEKLWASNASKEDLVKKNSRIEYKYRAELFIGGKKGDKIYYGKPVIYDKIDEDFVTHYMFPNEARLRNMTYAFSIHYDVDVEFRILKDKGEGEGVNKFESLVEYYTIEKVLLLGRFPIMMHSYLCILNKLNPEVRFNMGECRNDLGGYFIIDGKEKVIMSQEGRANNILYIKDKVNEIFSHAAEIRSVSEDLSKPIRTLSVRIVAPTPVLENNNIVVNIPNIRKPVPLFILMRALGVSSDKEIIEHCLLDLEKNKELIDLFIPSVYDAGNIFTQQSALKYIATLTKGK